MNIFVIEDEPPILREIVSTIHSINKDYTVIDTAQNGKDAIDKINALSSSIDIIITDINLPLMSGLDIIEFTKTNYPDILCIILSGYNDFSYAQRALHLSVLDYILKPVDEREMEAVLKSAWERKCVKKFAPKMVSRTPNTSTSSYYLAILCVDSYVWDNTYENDDVQITAYYANHFQQTLDRTLADQNFWLIDGAFSREKFLMMSIDGETSMKDAFQNIYEQLLLPNHGLTMVVNASPIGIESVNANCQTLREELKKVLSLEHSQLFFAPHSESLYEPLHYLKEITRLSTLFSAGNYSYFLNSLEQLLQEFKEHKLPLYGLIELINLLLSHCKSSVVKDGLDWNQQMSLSSDIFTYSYTYESLLTNIKSIFELIFSESQSTATESREALLIKLDVYINAHFREPINTQSLCSIFSFTPAYISKLYKDYKGITPSAYITQLRMEEAQKLLRESSMNIRDLSLYLGYDDPFYFSKLFKKIYGVSPKQYQKNNDE